MEENKQNKDEKNEKTAQDAAENKQAPSQAGNADSAEAKQGAETAGTNAAGPASGKASVEDKKSISKDVAKQLLGLKIAVGVLAVALVLLSVKIFWPTSATPSGSTPTENVEGGNASDPSDRDGDDDSEGRPLSGEKDDTASDKEDNSGGNASDESSSGKDSSDESSSGKDSSDENSSDKDNSEKDGSDKNSSGKDSSDKNSSGKGSSDKNSSGKDGSDKNSSGKGSSDKNSSGKDGSDKNSSGKGSSDKASQGYELIYSAGNSWEDNGTKMCTLDLSLTNHTGKSAKNWTLKLEVEDPVSITGWNGTYVIEGDTLTITPADYNSEIFPGGTIYLGCNIGTEGPLEIESAFLDGTACTLTNGTVDQNAQNSGSSSSGNGGGNDKINPSVDVPAMLERAEDAEQGDDWLHTDGRRILDKDGKEVWLTGVNWFGYNTGTNTFDGLWNSKLEPTVKAIADHGFNLIRVPFSAQLINQWAAGEYPQANFNQAYNASMTSMNSLEIFDYFLTLAEANGIKVMIDIHSAETNASGHTVNLWYTNNVSTENYYSALEWMAARYKDNDTIIAYDLKNEPHGKPNEGNAAAIWNDSKQSNNWKYVAETAAARVLAKNPNVLILVEGTEIYPKNDRGDYSSTNSDDYYFNWWGGNLRAVEDFPIDLGDYQDKLVYSPHDYGPTVYQQPWFSGGYTYESLMDDCWHDNWFYIYEDNTAPLLIGEWGGFMREPNLTWMTYMRQLIATYHLNHTFWCLNANSGDTGGLLLDDFTTWDSEKYEFVKQVLWQEDGKFVGLDHEIPLGENGIALKDAKGL